MNETPRARLARLHDLSKLDLDDLARACSRVPGQGMGGSMIWQSAIAWVYRTGEDPGADFWAKLEEAVHQLCQDAPAALVPEEQTRKVYQLSRGGFVSHRVWTSREEAKSCASQFHPELTNKIFPFAPVDVQVVELEVVR
jgi:hypothetical protein